MSDEGEIPRGTWVEIQSFGYKGIKGTIDRPAVPDRRDGAPRYYIIMQGKHMSLAFRRDEFTIIDRRK
jgi:hypothetical protein